MRATVDHTIETVRALGRREVLRAEPQAVRELLAQLPVMS